MASQKIKFRCFQCNTLLGVSQSKAGSIVSCPKCAVELEVPGLEESASAAAPAESSAEPDPAAVFRNLLESRPVPEPLNFGPEDIRAEPQGVRPSTPAASDPGPAFLANLAGAESPPQEPDAPFAFLQTEPVALRPEPAPAPRAKAAPGGPVPAAPARPAASEPAPWLAMAAEPAPLATSEPVVFPAIQTEAPTVRPQPPRPQPAAPSRSKAATPPPAAPAPPKPRVEQGPSPAPVPAAPTFATSSPAPASSPVAASAEASFPAIQVAPEPLRDEPPPIVGPLRVEAPSVAERAAVARRNDVVLPRTAVVLWSFFAVLGLVLAFATGLLAGHFLWTSPPPAQAAPAAAPPAHQPTGK